MASLNIGKLDDKLYELLRVRAVRHGVSVDEEARQILTRAISAPERTGDLFLKIFASAEASDLELSPREPHEPMDLKDSNPLEETAYLLRIPKNARRLTEAIADLERGDGTERE